MSNQISPSSSKKKSSNNVERVWPSVEQLFGYTGSLGSIPNDREKERKEKVHGGMRIFSGLSTFSW